MCFHIRFGKVIRSAVSLLLVAGLVTVRAAVVFAGTPARQHEEIKKEITSLHSGYLELENSLAKIRYFSNRAIKRTAMNVSLIKSGEAQYLFRTFELTIDQNPVFSHIYSEIENGALEMGGRQQLYDGNLTAGKHTLSVTMALHTKLPGSLVIQKEVTLPIELKEDVLSFFEVRISGAPDKPVLEISPIGEKRG